MQNDLKIVDLFCGAGGFSLGFEREGFDSILAIDKWNDAVLTYNHNREDKCALNIDRFLILLRYIFQYFLGYYNLYSYNLLHVKNKALKHHEIMLLALFLFLLLNSRLVML